MTQCARARARVDDLFDSVADLLAEGELERRLDEIDDRHRPRLGDQ